jgi:uracil-DNA glycosylase
MSEVRLEASWKQALSEEFEKPYFRELTTFVKQAYATSNVYPPPAQIFHALDACPVDQVRVVILGQDPYHGRGQAHGLAFSVPEGVTPPPSLQNIFKEIHNDVGAPIPASGDLEHWAKQGVLLLNATLTVEAGKPGSHQGKGWEIFTDAIMRQVSRNREQVVFLLWGRYAQQKEAHIDIARHLVLKAPHPSPYSAASGFFGCKHFSQANEYLVAQGKDPIMW